MRWEDERYVRLYTRDTVTWKLLPWQGRALLPLLLRKVDRAGMLDVGDPPAEGVAALVDLPLEVVEPGLAAIIARGTVILRGGSLVVPNFLEAQETPQSDRARQRAARERARAGIPKRDDSPENDAHGGATPVARVNGAEAADGSPGHGVTKRDDPSRNVTEVAPTDGARGGPEGTEPGAGSLEPVTKRDASVTKRDGTVTPCHAASHGVTPYCAVPYQAVPNGTVTVPSDGGGTGGVGETSPPGDKRPAAQPARPKRKAPVPREDTPPLPGTRERELYDAIVADPVLRPITVNPGDFATRMVAMYPDIDLVFATQDAGEFAAREGTYSDGRAFLRNQYRRFAAREATRARPASQAMTSTQLEAELERTWGPQKETAHAR